CGYGIPSFQTLLLLRTYEITAGQAAIRINTPVALSAAVGTFATRWLATRLHTKHPRPIARGPAPGLPLSAPFYTFALTTHSLPPAAIGLISGGFVQYGYLAAQYTSGQGVVSMRVRAMATAVMLLLVNLIGYGFGPLFIGLVSDILFNSGAAEYGVAAGDLA